MSDVAKVQLNVENEEPDSKRSQKFTEKGLSFQLQTCQEKRSAKNKQAKRLMEDLNKLMESKGNSKSVSSLHSVFIQCCQDAKDAHDAFTKLPLPSDELKNQNECFANKMTMYNEFSERVKYWLCDVAPECLSPNADNNNMNDEISPDDSASNIKSNTKSNVSKTRSQGSRASSTASARLKAEADKAALLEHVAALNKRHAIEAEEERIRCESEKLKREKEQLELQTQLAATNAKLRVLENNSQCGSKVSRASKQSDGMNSYLNKSIQAPAQKLNPCADVFVPEKMHTVGNHVTTMQQTVVRPKQKTESAHMFENKNTGFTSQTAPSFSDKTVPLKPQINQQPSVMDIMQRQNDITAMLVQQIMNSVLPPRDIPVFDGDPLQYKSFIRAFENGVEVKSTNWSDCLHFLEQYTRGQPRDLVHSCQHLPVEQGYQRAKELLAEHFGNEHKIAHAYMEKIYNWPPIKSEDIKALQSLSLFLRGCSNLTEHIAYMKELDLPTNMRNIILKLPYKLRERWRTAACELQEKRGQRALFTDLVAFIEKQVKIASDPLFGNIQDPQLSTPKTSNSSYTKQRKKGSFATNVTTVNKYGSKNKSPANQSCLYCSMSNHVLEKCFHFKEKLHKDKVNFIKEKGICFGCLKPGHTSKECRNRMDCSVCHQKHPTVLHIEQSNAGFPKNSQQPTSVSTTSILTQTCAHIGAGDEDHSVLSIVAVKVKSQKCNIPVQTYAFLVPGSTGTFCTESLSRKLNVKGKKASILLRTMGNKNIVNTNLISGLQVAALDDNDYIELPDVMTQKTMPVSKCNVPRQNDIEKWPYLQDVKLHDIDADVELLIGTDAAKVMEPWELINSQDEGPYAVRTRVGWVINGPLRGESKSKIGCSVVTANRISVENLENMLIQQYNHDFNEKVSYEQVEMSREDIKFMNIMNNTAELIDGHYCINLPFKVENPSLPLNRCVAEQRLQSLRRKFDKNSTFKTDYVAFLEDMIQSGYAELVPDDQLMDCDENVWYIPHHGVYHPRKNKLRVVFDCGATYKGTSLNCQLLQGPDLTNSVVGVLLRFRQEPIAVMADIQAMYHQVHVPLQHRNFLRFLWWPHGDTSQTPQEYYMKVHLFGAVSSPSCANYALRKTAEDNASHFAPDVINTIKHNFYVDDCLKSLPTEEAAIKMVQDLTALCNKGGFKLSKWLSNSRSVLHSISDHSKAKEILEMDLDGDELPVERALGLQWCTESDTFNFKICLQDQSHTRRGILSVVSCMILWVFLPHSQSLQSFYSKISVEETWAGMMLYILTFLNSGVAGWRT